MLTPTEIILRDADGRVRHHYVVHPHAALWSGGEPVAGPGGPGRALGHPCRSRDPGDDAGPRRDPARGLRPRRPEMRDGAARREGRGAGIAPVRPRRADRPCRRRASRQHPAAARRGSRAEAAPRRRRSRRPRPSRRRRPTTATCMRLSEIIGALAFLRGLCAAPDAAEWPARMKALMEAEGVTPGRRDRLAGAYNRGYRGYALTYRVCTPAANEAAAPLRRRGRAPVARPGRPLRRVMLQMPVDQRRVRACAPRCVTRSEFERLALTASQFLALRTPETALSFVGSAAGSFRRRKAMMWAHADRIPSPAPFEADLDDKRAALATSRKRSRKAVSTGSTATAWPRPPCSRPSRNSSRPMARKPPPATRKGFPERIRGGAFTTSLQH